MNEVCDLLAPSLELYAEGELRDARALRRLRRHLEGCPSCRGRVADHVALSRRLQAAGRILEGEGSWGGGRALGGGRLELELGGDPATARRRADRIMERIARLPLPGVRRRRPPWTLAAAALLLAAVAAAPLLRSLLPPERAGEEPSAAESVTAGLAPVPAAGGPPGAREGPGPGSPALAELQWVADPQAPRDSRELVLLGTTAGPFEALRGGEGWAGAYELALGAELLEGPAPQPAAPVLYLVPVGGTPPFGHGVAWTSRRVTIRFLRPGAGIDVAAPRERLRFRLVPAPGRPLLPGPLLAPVPPAPWAPLWEVGSVPALSDLSAVSTAPAVLDPRLAPAPAGERKEPRGTRF